MADSDLDAGDDVPSRDAGVARSAASLRWESLLVVLLVASIAYGASVSPYFLEWTNLVLHRPRTSARSRSSRSR